MEGPAAETIIDRSHYTAALQPHTPRKSGVRIRRFQPGSLFRDYEFIYLPWFSFLMEDKLAAFLERGSQGGAE
jgi:hypothetical protein